MQFKTLISMKKILSIIILASLSFSGYAQSERVFQADTLCQNNKFEEASAIYEEILAGGQENSKIYYNLGYAYFKQGMTGKSILNFERAKRLAPNDEDVTFNLEQLYLLTDKVEVIEPVFFVVWWRNFCDVASSDGWAWIFVVIFVLMLVGVGFFMFSDSVALRKTGFFSAIILVIFAVVSLSISIEKRNESLYSTEAIIMSPSTTLSTSPDKYGSEMAVLHEGTYVLILSELGDWCQVKLKDGNIGWIRLKDLEVI